MAEQKTIQVSDLLLDPANPRFAHLQLQGITEQSQKDLQSAVEDDKETTTLLKAIRKAGVKDPIWVRENGDGKYVVFEGNRRTTILRKLVRENVAAPPGVRFDEVLAHVLPHDTPETELLLQKARLQSGKKDWGPFNEAAVVHQLREKHLLEYEDIAAELQLSIAKVKDRIHNYELFEKYSKKTADVNPKRFSYFSDAPKAVRDWYEQDNNLDRYFSLISPKTGRQKIRSVTTAGGLRDFAKVIEDTEALGMLINDPSVTVADALEIVKENNVYRGIPFINRIEPMAKQIRSLGDAEVEKLRAEKKVQIQLKSLARACDELHAKLTGPK